MLSLSSKYVNIEYKFPILYNKDCHHAHISLQNTCYVGIL